MADEIAYIRLLIGDTGTTGEQIFTEDDIQTVLGFEASPKLAAAQLLERLAGSELLLSKKIQSQDLATDGPAVAKELRALADSLRRQHDTDTAAQAWSIASWDTAGLAPAGRPEATEYPIGGPW